MYLCRAFDRNLLTTATVPRRSIANRRVNRRLHMWDKRKLRSSKLFCRAGPTYTPYHMMVESRPLNLLIRLIGAPLRLRRRYHADPLLTGASFDVYTCVTIANYTVASSLAAQDLPTHHYHMMVESRPLYLLLCLILAPLRLQRRYQAHPLLTGTSIVVYICGTNVNYAVASSFAEQDQPDRKSVV